MFKKFLFVTCLIITFNTNLQSQPYIFSELSATLQQLQTINSKFIPSDIQKITQYPIPNAEFYKKLEPAINETLKGNSALLDAFGDNRSAEVVKYMISTTEKIARKIGLPETILLLVQLYDRLQAAYKPSHELIITSVASGDLVNEKILLETLDHFGYKSAKFYAIDPSEATIKALNELKNNSSLNQYKYYLYKNTKSYIEDVIKRETPDICVTFSPGLFEKSHSSYFLPTNICDNRRARTKEPTFLFLPNTIEEISIATSNSVLLDSWNKYLKENPALNSEEIGKYLVNDFQTRYPRQTACYENIALEFLEIVKLASTANKDCIAYYKGPDIATYNHISSESLADLYLGASGMRKYYQDLLKVDLTNFKIWTYSSKERQFKTKNS